MTRIAEEGAVLACKSRVKPGPKAYMWADCIADALYTSYYRKKLKEAPSLDRKRIEAATLAELAPGWCP